MAKKQTRRSVSFSRADYEAAQEAAQRAKVPVAQLAAEALHEYLERRSAHGSESRATVAPALTRAAASDMGPNEVPTDAPTDRSSVGAGRRNIGSTGIDALDDELRAAERTDVQVMYDDDVQAKRNAAARRKR